MVMSPHWPSVRSLDDLFDNFKGAQSARKSIADHCLSLGAGLQQVHSSRGRPEVAIDRQNAILLDKAPYPRGM